MKNVFMLSMLTIASALFVSCNNHDHDDDLPTVQSLFAQKIDSVRIPMDTMSLGVTQEFLLYSNFTKGCEGIYDVEYLYTNDYTRTVTNYAFKSNMACASGTYVDEGVVNFKPKTTGTYTFKFWSGKNASNVDTFIEKKVVVE